MTFSGTDGSAGHIFATVACSPSITTVSPLNTPSCRRASSGFVRHPVQRPVFRRREPSATRHPNPTGSYTVPFGRVILRIVPSMGVKIGRSQCALYQQQFNGHPRPYSLGFCRNRSRKWVIWPFCSGSTGCTPLSPTGECYSILRSAVTPFRLVVLRCRGSPQTPVSQFTREMLYNGFLMRLSDCNRVTQLSEQLNSRK